MKGRKRGAFTRLVSWFRVRVLTPISDPTPRTSRARTRDNLMLCKNIEGFPESRSQTTPGTPRVYINARVEKKERGKSWRTKREPDSRSSSRCSPLEYLNKSACRPPLKSLSRISNNVRRAWLDPSFLESHPFPYSALPLPCLHKRARPISGL